MQEVLAAESELDLLTAAADTALTNATAALMEAEELNSQAQMLEDDATSISLDDLNGKWILRGKEESKSVHITTSLGQLVSWFN